MSDAEELIKLAKERFKDFGEADEILFAAVADGKTAQYKEGGDKDKLENVDNWGERRIIKANRIEWLCRDKQAKELVTDKGIQVVGAKIDGRVDLSFAEIPFPLGTARCVFNEEINMQHSRMKILNLGGYCTGSIRADGVEVKGDVYLRNGFKAEGEVRFVGATIGGDFDCTKGEFINRGGAAIFAEGMDVKGSVYLAKGFKAEGMVSFIGAIVGGHFIWTDVNLTEKTELDLRDARAGVLWDDEESWPVKGKLFLGGFAYENIGDYAPKDAKSRIEWLNRQSEEQFRPGPYEQLAKVLNKMGHSEDAKKILIEKEKKITRLSGFGWRMFWRGILGVTIGYGYRPWRALWFIGAFILIGFMVFQSGYKTGVIVPVEKDAYESGQCGLLREGYPKFNAFIYSVEMFVPVVDLRMAKYWMPDATKAEMLSFRKYNIPIRGDFIRGYMWVHIGAGWILTTLLVVGLTGLVKK